MGSGGWLKKIISSKKEKNSKERSIKEYSASNYINGLNEDTSAQKETTNTADNTADKNPGPLAIPVEAIAAIRIQKAFRIYKARKVLRHLKGTLRLRTLTLGSSASMQVSATLTHLHTWSRIQSEIRARRISMATEARIRHKKVENQLKLDSKLHDLEVEWTGGTETMDEALGKIHLREAATVKRERAMAYAFSHQWRATSKPDSNDNGLEKCIWGWSLTERWIAARPWESRALVVSSPKKAVSRQSSKTGNNQKSPTMKLMPSFKSISPNAKGTLKSRKLSYGAPDQEAASNKEQMAY
ncbi:Protein IQ-DOMAIN 1 [Heracleum sosnowskyi]|uniref:Protein IQ-DOMAIN 1 n=1 Tax=Heracleum sosnowskyi TaxID=360622 RepID=A0AAD8HZ47_9APIA|nr:Protein IQ-DOMAIN 1 [Heracleum sosnowskyi]